MRIPFFDGREPLTKEVANAMTTFLQRADRQTVGGSLGMVDLGTSGRLLVGGKNKTQVGFTEAGFWARIHIGPGDNMPTLVQGMKQPVAWWIEQMVGGPTVIDNISMVDNPVGRKGFVENHNSLYQGIVNYGDGIPLGNIAELIFSGITGGTFTLSVGGPTSGAIAYPPTTATVASALNALPRPVGVASWNVLPGVSGTLTDGSAGLALIVVAVPSNLNNPPTVTVILDGTLLVGPGAASLQKPTVLGTGKRLFNLSPKGELVWCQVVLAQDGTRHGVFQIPFKILWAKLTGIRDGVPPAYGFVEVTQATSFPGWMDRQDGIRGQAYELNGDMAQSLNTIVPLVPLFCPGNGWFYLFQGLSEVRLLKFLGGAAAPNCQIVRGRTYEGDRGFMIRPDGTAGNYNVGAYYVGQRSGNSDVWPRFLTPEFLGNASLLVQP